MTLPPTPTPADDPALALAKRQRRRYDYPDGYSPSELEDLAHKVAEQNDGKHGDPQRSPYQWNIALLFARAHIATNEKLALVAQHHKDACARERAIISARDTANAGRHEWFKRAEQAQAAVAVLKSALIERAFKQDNDSDGWFRECTLCGEQSRLPSRDNFPHSVACPLNASASAAHMEEIKDGWQDISSAPEYIRLQAEHHAPTWGHLIYTARQDADGTIWVTFLDQDKRQTTLAYKLPAARKTNER